MQCRKKSGVVKACVQYVWLEFQGKRRGPWSQDVLLLCCIYGAQQQAAAAASLQPVGAVSVLMSTTAGSYWQQGCYYVLSPSTTTILLNLFNKYNQETKAFKRINIYLQTTWHICVIVEWSQSVAEEVILLFSLILRGHRVCPRTLKVKINFKTGHSVYCNKDYLYMTEL